MCKGCPRTPVNHVSGLYTGAWGSPPQHKRVGGKSYACPKSYAKPPPRLPGRLRGATQNPGGKKFLISWILDPFHRTTAW